MVNLKSNHSNNRVLNTCCSILTLPINICFLLDFKTYVFYFLAKLKGMNEHMAKVTLINVGLEIPKAIFEIANVTRVITEKENTFR